MPFIPEAHDFASSVSSEFAAEILDALDACRRHSPDALGDAVQTIYARAERDDRVAGLLRAWSQQYGLAGHVHAETSLLRKIAADLNDRRGK